MLRQIEDLKSKAEGGATLDKDQLAKVSKEESLKVRCLYGALYGALHGALYRALHGALHGALYGALYACIGLNTSDVFLK